MANIFDDIRLPEDIERGATGGPAYRTTIIQLVNGREQRNREWESPLDQFNIGYGIKRRDDLEAVYAFYRARNGRARGFRFRNWLDFEVTGAPVGSITGEPTKRQLVRIYDDEVNPVIRLITRPILSTLKVYINNILTEDYSIDPLGVIVFPNDPGEDVKASFQFDIPARFDTDVLNVQLNTYREGSFPSISVIELRE